MDRIGALMIGLVLTLGGCSVGASDFHAGSIKDIAVTIDDKGNPVLEYPADLEYSKVQTQVLWSGTGDLLNPGDRILLDMYSVSLDSGVVLVNTYSDLPNAYLLAPELVGQELYDVLVKERVGSRLLHVSPPVEGFEGHGAVALVIDVLPSKAIGETQSRREGFPVVILEPNGFPTIIIGEDLIPPIGLETATLILGTGPQIRPGSRIKANYHSVSFATGEVFESSWDDGEGPMEARVGVGELPLGLDQGLIDHAEGSQVLLLVPPELAYGEDHLVFVIDILAVRSQE